MFAQGSGFEGPAPFSGGLCTYKGSKVSVCMGFPSLLNRLCKVRYSASFGTGLGRGGGGGMSTVSLQKICTFSSGFPTGSVLCKLPSTGYVLLMVTLTGYVLLMVHTSLYSFSLAASLFAQGSGFEGHAPFSAGLCTCKGSKVSVCIGFSSLLNGLCELWYSAGFGTGWGGGGGVGMSAGSQFATIPVYNIALSLVVFPLVSSV